MGTHYHICLSNCEQHYSNVEGQMPFRLMSSPSDKPWGNSYVLHDGRTPLYSRSQRIPFPPSSVAPSTEPGDISLWLLLFCYYFNIPVCACGRACMTRRAYEGCNLSCCPFCLRQECLLFSACARLADMSESSSVPSPVFL